MGKKDSSGKRAFKWSLALHGTVFAAAVLFMLYGVIFSRKEQEPYVMELMGGPPVKNPEPKTAAPSSEPEDKLQAPSLPKLDERDIPKPKEEPVKEVPPSPPKKETPKEPAKETPKLIDYSQFTKDVKLPPKVQNAPKKKPSKPRVTAATLDTSAVLRDLRNNLSREDSDRLSSMSVAEQGQLFDYFQWVASLIDTNFAQPSGIVEGTSAWVQFNISALGVVSRARVVESSGNAAFDRAAVAAVQALGKLTAPPGKVAYTRKIQFIAE